MQTNQPLQKAPSNDSMMIYLLKDQIKDLRLMIELKDQHIDLLKANIELVKSELPKPKTASIHKLPIYKKIN